MPAIKSKQAGFSLIEIIMSIAVFIVIASGVATAVIGSNVQSLAINKRLAAVSETKSVMTMIQAGDIIPSANPQFIRELSPLVISQTKPEAAAIVHEVLVINNQVQITTTWQAPGGNLQTYSVTTNQ